MDSPETGSTAGVSEAPPAVIPSQGDLLGDLLNLDLTPPATAAAPTSGIQMGAVDLLGGGLDSLVGLSHTGVCRAVLNWVKLYFPHNRSLTGAYKCLQFSVQAKWMKWQLSHINQMRSTWWIIEWCIFPGFSMVLFIFIWPLCVFSSNAAPSDGRWIWTGNYMAGGGTIFRVHSIIIIHLAYSVAIIDSEIFVLHLSSFVFLLAVKYSNPCLILSGLFDLSHIWISHLFPCGWTLLSHLSSLISPHRPQITAPLRLVPGTMLDQRSPLVLH